MPVLKFFYKKLMVIYISICIAALVLYLSGYSFSIDFLDYLMIAIILLYPIVKFIKSPTQLWLKFLIVILVAAPFFLIGKDVLMILAFGSESTRKVQEWKVDGYKIVLTERIGWSGGWYDRYDLTTYKVWGLINKTIAYGHMERDSVGTVSCMIQFASDDYDNHDKYEFNSCTKILKKI
jgi:hypothetical protein